MTSSIAVPSEALRAQHRKGEVDEGENREDESDDLVDHGVSSWMVLRRRPAATAYHNAGQEAPPSLGRTLLHPNG